MARVSADQRREEFIEAAVGIIGIHGVSGATTRRIADAAGAPLATLHYCFRAKEDLFLAVFQKQLEGMAERIDMLEGVGLRQAAAELLGTSADWYMENPRFARAQFDLFLWATRQEGDHTVLANQIYDLFVDRFIGALRRAADPQDDPEFAVPLANFIISSLDGLVLEWCAHQDVVRLKSELAVASEAIELLVESRRSDKS